MAMAAPWGLTTDKRTGGSFGSRLRSPHRPLGVGLEPTRSTVDGDVCEGAAAARTTVHADAIGIETGSGDVLVVPFQILRQQPADFVRVKVVGNLRRDAALNCPNPVGAIIPNLHIVLRGCHGERCEKSEDYAQRDFIQKLLVQWYIILSAKIYAMTKTTRPLAMSFCATTLTGARPFAMQ